MMASNDPLHPEALKDKQRRLRDGFSTPLTLRVHRSLSWLRRAQGETDDLDVRFILLWIGFNAAYAGDIEASPSRPRRRASVGCSRLSSRRWSGSIVGTASTIWCGSGSVRKFGCCLATAMSITPSGSIRMASPGTPIGQKSLSAAGLPSITHLLKGLLWGCSFASGRARESVLAHQMRVQLYPDSAGAGHQSNVVSSLAGE
jgi:hypothetical protein